MRRLSKGASRARAALGTLVEIRLRDPGVAGEAFEHAFAAIERVHRCMSRQDADSDVARINRAQAGSCVAVDAWTRDVLQRAQELHAATGGLFDCALGAEGDGSLDDLELAAEGPIRLRRRVVI